MGRATCTVTDLWGELCREVLFMSDSPLANSGGPVGVRRESESARESRGN